MTFTPVSVRSLKTGELKTELDAHCLLPKGNKFTLMKTLVNHYGHVDHIDQARWSPDMIQKSLRGLKKKSKAGRKRKSETD